MIYLSAIFLQSFTFSCVDIRSISSPRRERRIDFDPMSTELRLFSSYKRVKRVKNQAHLNMVEQRKK